MAKRTVITEKGMELLASSSQATGQYWWIGYYGLAYVPNSWKEDPISIPEEEDRCNAVNSPRNDSLNNWVDEDEDADLVVPQMTRLTKYGDMIYNIFQGDLVGTGYYNCVSDGSSGGDLFGLTMYNSNIKKHYRYVLNEYGNNTLVTWVDLPEDTTEGLMKGKYVYLGTDGFTKSNMAIPAPLYYMGDTGHSSVDNYFPDFTDDETNGSSIYPYIEVWNGSAFVGLGLKPAGVTKISVPKITVDYREYLDSQGYTEAQVYTGNTTNNPTNNGSGDVRTEGGQYFDSLEVVSSGIDSNFDNTSWFAANLTMLADNGTVVDATLCKEFWKLHSISNYNKYHAPVGSTGHVLSSDLSNRNMAKVTKFFPISNYKVITTESGNNTSGNAVEFATGISISIDLDLAPRTKAQGSNDDTGDFDETASLTFFDKYDLSNNEDYHALQTEQTYYDDTDDIIEDQFGKNIFNTAHTSFKFNRIGLYAVSLRKCPFVKDVADPTGKDVTIQFEINPDIEPVLFAVVDWDNTVHLDDTGDGIHQFRADINLNLVNPLSSIDNLDADSLVRDSTIFYNMYEDDAIKWYQNQLIATASTQNAITEIGLKIGHMEKKVEQALSVCPPTDLNKKFSAKDHNHPYEGLRHLYDGIALGSLRGVNTRVETSDLGGGVYYLIGENSIVLGGGTDDTYVHDSDNSSILGGINNKIISADNSVISGGDTNKIDTGATHSVISGGATNWISNDATHSVISGGAINAIADNYSVISGGEYHQIWANYSVISGGNTNTINASATHSVISGGDTNKIDTGATHSVISGGASNWIVDNATHSVISGGDTNKIGNGSTHSVISCGWLNEIVANAAYAVISGGNANKIGEYARVSVISGGELNEIAYNATHSVISGGDTNKILEGATHSVISGGNTNTINASATHSVISGGSSNNISATYSVISGGSSNDISGNSTHSVVSGGNLNTIIDNYYSVISGGDTNNISNGADYSVISGGISNNIMASAAYSVISGGISNIIATGATHSVISGGNSNVIGAGDTYSVISGGISNNIDAGATHSVISGGNSNFIDTGATYSVISGGNDNAVGEDATHSVISGGASNQILDNATHSVILGGSSNSTSAPYSVVSGIEAVAFGYGEVTHAVGKFSTAGDAQFTRLIFKGESENETPINLTLGDGSDYDFGANYPGKQLTFAGKATFHGDGGVDDVVILSYDFVGYYYPGISYGIKAQRSRLESDDYADAFMGFSSLSTIDPSGITMDFDGKLSPQITLTGYTGSVKWLVVVEMTIIVKP